MLLSGDPGLHDMWPPRLTLYRRLPTPGVAFLTMIPKLKWDIRFPRGCPGDEGPLLRKLRKCAEARFVYAVNLTTATLPVPPVRHEHLLVVDAAGQLGRISGSLSLECTTDESRLRHAADFSNFTCLQQSEKLDGFSERMASVPSSAPERPESDAGA